MFLFRLICVTACFQCVTNVPRQSHSHETNCYNNLCKCKGNTATCVWNGHNLTYIPRLPRKTTCLLFSHNFLERVTDRTFVNLTRLRLKRLSLEDNHINFISGNAFASLRFLEDLGLDSNVVPASGLYTAFYGLKHLPLKNLSMTRMGLRDESLGFLQQLTTSNVTQLFLDNNNLTICNHSIFSTLKFLQTLRVSHNKIEKVTLSFSASVHYLNLRDNRLPELPNFCPRGDPYFPNLHQLRATHNKIDDIDPLKFKCLSRLSLLSLGANPIRVLRKNTFSGLPSLQYLLLRHMTGTSIQIQGYAFNNTHLKYLSLTANRIHFKTEVSIDSFRGCTTLDSLDLSYSMFQEVQEEQMDRLFGHLHSLTGLGLGNCGLRTFPRVISQNLTSLKYLKLYKNLISTLPKNTFEKLTSLTHLWLGGNLISVINEDSFPSVFLKQLEVINLADNPFSCTCDLLWFLEWIKKDHHKFQQYPQNYWCNNKNKLSLAAVDISEQSCLLTYTATMVIFGCSITVISLIVIVALLYNWRWQIKYYIYMLRYHRKANDERQNDVFEYDVFLCYCSNDVKWVKEEAIPILEDTANLKLCVHQRDFDIGGFIVDNIVKSVESSRRILIILSNKFAESQWCQFELALTQRHVLEKGHQPLVVAMLEEIDPRNLTSSLQTLLQTTTYVMWGEEEEIKRFFWERLINALKRPNE